MFFLLQLCGKQYICFSSICLQYTSINHTHREEKTFVLSKKTDILRLHFYTSELNLFVFKMWAIKIERHHSVVLYFQVSVDKVLKTLKENANKATSILLSAIPQIGSMEWTDTLHTLKVSIQMRLMSTRGSVCVCAHNTHYMCYLLLK